MTIDHRLTANWLVFVFFFYIFYFWLRMLDQADHTLAYMYLSTNFLFLVKQQPSVLISHNSKAHTPVQQHTE